MTAQEITLTVPRSEWLTANGRYHWANRARATRALRWRAHTTARSQGMRPMGPSRVTVAVAYPTAARADPDNAAPTVKAIIDGLVDAGVWPDDNSRWRTHTDYTRAPRKAPRGTHTITIRIEEEE